MTALEEKLSNMPLEHEPQEICGFVVSDCKEIDFCLARIKQQIQQIILRFLTKIISVQKSAVRLSRLFILILNLTVQLKLSTQDRQMQVQTGLEWWLVHNKTQSLKKFRNIPHLLGRDFDHGITGLLHTLPRCLYVGRLRNG